MLKYLRFYFALIKFNTNLKLVYNINFWSILITDIIVFIIQILVFSTIYLNVESINGWNRYQVIFFVGTFMIIDELYMATYFFGTLKLPGRIQDGTLDLYLTKPISAKFFITFEEFNFASLIGIIPGIMILIYSINHLNIQITIIKVAGYIFLLIIMYFLNYFLMLIIRIPSFWIISLKSIEELENELVNFAFRIPGIVYKGIAKLIFCIFLPYGLIATVPTQFFTDVLELKYIIIVLCVFVSYWIITTILWKIGLRQYNSSSS